MEKERIHSFEKLDVYKLAREFSRKVGEFIKILPEEEKYRLKGQMKRAKLSITNNIAEGYGRYHYQENIHPAFGGTRGSICELIDDFNECYDEGYIDAEYLNCLKNDAYCLIKVPNGYIASIKRQKQKDELMTQ